MDEEIQIEGAQSLGDDFYEKIEAPKFVDLTAPDRHRSSIEDRYWFCLRVGCDQKHEEEMDSEAIYKNFVLRVMAARSPNVRLRKALYGKKSSANAKCPLTVPAKPSRSRVSRLALISSISQKMVDGKVKGRALPKHGGTPMGKEKQSSVLAKCLTSPRNKKRLSNHGTFHTVRNPKPTTIAVPKNRIVAKALVFHSPKKTVRIKTSAELSSRMRTICAGMKKLEITSGKKNLSNCNKPLPVDASRKQFRGREVKSRVYDSLRSQNCRSKEAKSAKCLKKKDKEKDLLQACCTAPGEETENDSSDMEIEGKSRNGSLEVCSTSGTCKTNESNKDKECLVTLKVENEGEALSDASTGDTTSLSNCGERDKGEHDIADFPVPSEEDSKTNEGSSVENNQIKPTLEKRVMPGVIKNDENENASDDKENTGEVMRNCDNKENAGEVMNNCDDKENASSSDGNRKMDLKSSHMEKKKTLGIHEEQRSTRMRMKGMGKTSKGNSTAAVACAEGVNYRKPKLTNPKPFRLRTDERRILKEANLEKKLHRDEPPKEITKIVKSPGGNLQRRPQNAVIQRDEKCIEQIECTSDGHEGSEKEPQRMGIQTPEGAIRKKSTTPQRRMVAASEKEFSQDKEAKRSEGSLKRTKLSYMKALARTRGIESSKKKTINSRLAAGQLGVIKESSPTVSRTKVAAKPMDNGASQAVNKTLTPTTSSMRRKPTTPKEPHFHNVHVPKSCVRRVA
ncbi:uncharacterized protein LOC116120114 [Pistacia vera]|uniref:uncharacterized protein LOC116120114 n=1 Tax=Pistacia vera TaxID=55513 RepID=UPI001262D0C2|nr:uncharacterized protein LOC116120114 [Pistacia vera]